MDLDKVQTVSCPAADNKSAPIPSKPKHQTTTAAFQRQIWLLSEDGRCASPILLATRLPGFSLRFHSSAMCKFTTEITQIWTTTAVAFLIKTAKWEPARMANMEIPRTTTSESNLSHWTRRTCSLKMKCSEVNSRKCTKKWKRWKR